MLALNAYNRRDLEAAIAGAHPDFEYRPGREWVEAGLVEESYCAAVTATGASWRPVDEVWGGQNYLTPVGLVDVGERFVVLAEGRMRAQASGVWLDRP